MNRNRDHANRPTIRDQYDMARQRAAIARADAARRRAEFMETLQAWATVALIVGLTIVMFRSI